MKVIAIVGTKKTGKTTLACRLIASLSYHGKVGTIKNMATHKTDSGDTRRHFDAGADVVIGLGLAKLKLSRDRGDLDMALRELQADGVDYVVVEGFKQSRLPKLVLAEMEAEGCLKKLSLADFNDDLIEELTRLVLSLEDYRPES